MIEVGTKHDFILLKTHFYKFLQNNDKEITTNYFIRVLRSFTKNGYSEC